MTDTVLPPPVSYIGSARGLHASHCRDQAARFRWLAQRETLAQMRRHLAHLAREYDELAVAQERHTLAADTRVAPSVNDNSRLPGGLSMPFKPNYRFERVERERLKKAKKEEKLRRQQERTSEAGDAAGATAVEPPPPES